MATASEWWVHFFGDAQDCEDYTGIWIKKAAYKQSGSKYGWVLEYIQPLDNGGVNDANNIHIVSCEANVLRDGKITYTIDGTRYQVQRDWQSGARYAIKVIGDKRLSFWDREFPANMGGLVSNGAFETVEVDDFAGYRVKKHDYRDEQSEHRWDIDHIQPLSKGGTDTDDNKQVVSIYANREKGDKTTFVIDGHQYQVRKTKNTDKREWAGGYDYSNKKYCIVEMR
jgi:hypothetical protein